MLANDIKLCPSCMSEDIEYGICPVCGFNENEYVPEEDVLPIGSVLTGKYIVGKVIGRGGFGITYVGYDINLKMKVAIKELFYKKYATRAGTTIVADESYKDQIEEMKKSFLDEARKIARFDRNESIVSVKDFFFSNNTAYIVMEYISGETIHDRVQQNGPMPFDETLKIFEPLIGAIADLHDDGMVHLDISPDNIIITKENKLKLIDFGTACYSQQGKIIVKKGFSPIEQYSSEGFICPATDIYALCATLYYAMTGLVPQESIQRLDGDELINIGGIISALPYGIGDAIMQGLEVDLNLRIPDSRQLYYYIYINNEAVLKEVLPMQTAKAVSEVIEYSTESEVEKKHKFLNKKFIILCAGVLIILLCGAGLILFTALRNQRMDKTANVELIAPEKLETISETESKLDNVKVTDELLKKINEYRTALEKDELIVSKENIELAEKLAEGISDVSETDVYEYCQTKIEELNAENASDESVWLITCETIETGISEMFNNLLKDSESLKLVDSDVYTHVGIAVSEEKEGNYYYIFMLSK